MFQTLKLLVYMEGLLLLAVAAFVWSLHPAQRAIVRPGHVVAIAAIPVVGLFARYAEAFYLFVFLLPIVLAAGDARRLACAYVFLLVMFPGLQLGMVAGSVFLLDFSASNAFNLGGLVALLVVSNKQKQRVAIIDAALLIVFVLMTIAATRGEDFGTVYRQIITYTMNILPGFYIVARGIRNERAASDVGLFFVLGGFCNAGVAIFESRRSWPLFESFYIALNVPFRLTASLAIRAGFLRAQGVLSNPTVLCVLLALAVLVCVALRHRFSRLGFYVVLGTLAAGMIASQSRGGVLAAVAGLILFWWYERRALPLVMFGLAGSMAALIVLALPAESRIGQLSGRSGGAQGTADYRSSLFTNGMREIRQHPALGQDTNTLEVTLNDMRQGEGIIDYVNTHLYMALTTGLLGLAFWLTAWMMALVVLWRRRPRRATAGDLTPGLGFAMIGMCFVALTFTSFVDRMLPLTAISFGMASALTYLSYARQAGHRSKSDAANGLLARSRRPLAARSVAAELR